MLTTASAVVFLALIFQPSSNPYFGIVVFLVVPALFVLGLLLMPLGFFLAGRPRIPIEPARRWRRVVARLKLLADRDARTGKSTDSVDEHQQDQDDE